MRFLPQRRLFRPTFALLFISLGMTGSVCAQIRHIDYTSMNQQISPQGAASFYMDPSAISSQMQPGMDRFVGKAPNMDKFISITHAQLGKGNITMGNSPLNGKMDTASLWQKMYNNPGNLTEKLYPQTNTRDPHMDTALQRDSKLNDFTQYDQLKPHQSGPSKYSDAFVFHTEDNNQPLQDVGRELSLQDINRYQFQGSHSGEPGLPSTHAGTASTPTFTGSALASGPATFDGAALQGGKVTSGSSSQMRLITPNGSQPYQPFSLGSSHPADFSGAGSSSKSGSSTRNSNYDMVYSQAQSLQTGKASSTDLKGAAFMPSGDYTPKSSNGNAVPMSFDAPKMIIQVKKGGFVKVGEDKSPDQSSP